MQRARPSGRVDHRRLTTSALATLVALAAAGCSTGDSLNSGPVLPPEPPQFGQLRAAAFLAEINTQTREVKITPPKTVTVNSHNAWVGPNGSASNDGGTVGSQSLLGGDVITLIASNYAASAVGAFQPGKIRVSFDVSIFNKLSSAQLSTPTFPTPPSSVTGILLFPFSTQVTTTSGGVAVGGGGNDVIVTQPNQGLVAPSPAWDGDGTPGNNGTPFSFFNDISCSVTPPAGVISDCFPYEAYAVPLLGNATSAARPVGFDIDPTVGNFTAKLILAADLANSGPAPVGTVAGLVSSPQRGNLSGVLVTVNTGGFTGTTGAAGTYSIANVTTGPKTVSLSGLPSGCTDPGPQSTTVRNGATSTVNFTVVCTAASGTVTGSITRTGPATPSLAAVTITATPGASGTTPASAALGGASPTSYSIANVLVGSGAGAGSGALALSNLPGGCTSAPASGSYTGLTLGGTVTGTGFTIDCQTPPAFYQYTAAWSAISGGSVTLTLTFDPSTLNDPAVNGPAADDFNAFQARVTYTGTSRLTFGSCANTTGSAFTNITASSPSAGIIDFLNFKTGAGSITAQGVATCTFTVGSGTPTTATTSTSLTVVSSFSGADLIPKTQKNEGTLSIP